MWEYKTLKVKPKGFLTDSVVPEQMDATLNELGRERWELVSVFTTTDSNVIAILKRPR